MTQKSTQILHTGFVVGFFQIYSIRARTICSWTMCWNVAQKEMNEWVFTKRNWLKYSQNWVCIRKELKFQLTFAFVTIAQNNLEISHSVIYPSGVPPLYYAVLILLYFALIYCIMHVSI